MAFGLHAFGSTGRVRTMLAATALAGGSVLAVSVSATPALATTPAQLVITTTAPLTATAGSAYVAKLDATGGTKPYSWSLTDKTSLPAGLVLHASTGQITGTPLGPGGTFGFTAEVTDAENPAVSATAAESITVVVNPLTVLTAALPPATAGVAYSQTLSATGGVSPYSWSIPVGALPAGLVLHAASGVISGTPKVGGNFTFTAEVTDSEVTPQSAGAPESITVGVAGLVVTTGSTLPTATSGVPYSVKLGASGGITPYAWTVASGTLPAGLKLAKTGVLSGTTTATTTGSGGGPQPGGGPRPGGGGQPGPDTFTVQVTDTESPAVSATENMSLYVVNPMVVPTSLPGASLGASYDQSLQPTGGLGPYSYAITAGALPNGLALQTDGEITGQPTADGTSNFTVSVTDSENPPATISQAESITVTQPFIYVATDGSDSNAGTQAAPMQTIGGAITLAASFGGDTVIDVAGGTYNEGSGVNLINNVTINGGYDESTWTQTSSTPTTIVGSPQAVLADGAAGASLGDVTLAPTAPSTPGDSVYGLRAIDGSSVSLADVTINTPDITVTGSQGSAGQMGGAGNSGGNGGPGDSSDQCAALSSNGGGGAGGNGGGGAGGAGADCGNSPPPCVIPLFQSLSCSELAIPGSSDPTGSDGSPGYGGSGGTNTIASAGVTWQGQSGFTGNDGGAGYEGAGGGGGSEVGGCDYGTFGNTCDSAAGGGGGGGYGGGYGGGSFGVYLDSATVTFTSPATITVGNGGSGGEGGFGALGGTGGSGGAGGPAGYDDGPVTQGMFAGQGGNGADGGAGGFGGGGGGGAGGPSIGIFAGGNVSGLPNVTISVGAGGAGGIPGSGGPACVINCIFYGQPGYAGLAEAIAYA